MATSLRRRFGFASIACLLLASGAAPAHADEIWVSPTYQQDAGGLGVGSNVIWPVTAAGIVRLGWAIPDNLQTLQGARVAIIPGASAGGPTALHFYVCAAENGDIVSPAPPVCTGPFAQTFTSAPNQLVEVEIGGVLSQHLGTPGLTYLAVLAYTTPAITTDHIVGLRFAYAPKTPTGVATLAANTFSGTQTAPAFVGDGSGLTNLPVPAGAATLGANVFSGPQTAPAFVGSGAGLTNLPFPAGAAKLTGGNDFTGPQVISAGNLDLQTSTPSVGVLTKNGQPFLHGGDFHDTFGNTFLGVLAGNFTMTGSANTGIGKQALVYNTNGSFNTALGFAAMALNTTGSSNTAVGQYALESNQTGLGNVAVGGQALETNQTGSGNVAVGASALRSGSAGSDNVAVGAGALPDPFVGSNNIAVGSLTGRHTTGSNNIYLGSYVSGAEGESNTMYLGGTQTRTFVAGIRGTTTANNDAIPVVIDSAGQLGTVSSSVRFKEDIHDMADASQRLFDLRPVTFRYAKPYANGSKPLQFGLVAEEVAAAFPELAVRDVNGNVETVHYETLSVLLLNEVQRQQRELSQERSMRQEQQERIDLLERRLDDLLSARETDPGARLGTTAPR